MKRFGLIGYPASHSLSPSLFRAAYGEKYAYDIIENPDFDAAYGKFLGEYDGVNVTAPFKELAAARADILSPECRRTGAANLLVKSPDGIKAFNTDCFGVLGAILSAADPAWSPREAAGTAQAESLRGIADAVRSRLGSGMAAGVASAGGAAACGARPLMTGAARALVIGGGGAARAAAAAMSGTGLETILANRTESKARRIAEEMQDSRIHVLPFGMLQEIAPECDIIVIAIPRSGYCRIPALSRKDGKTRFILEADYRNPAGSAASGSGIRTENGATVISGVRWLLYQAYYGYGLFTGESPSLSAMKKIICGTF